VKPGDIASGGIGEPQLSSLGELHHGDRSEALGMRGGADAVARREPRAARKIGCSERGFEDEALAVTDGDDAAGLLVLLELEFEPAPDRIERRLKPLRVQPSLGDCCT